MKLMFASDIHLSLIHISTIDSEVIAYHIARERVRSKTAEEAVARAMQKIKGAYSLVIMSPRKLMGARDPQGFRPLCIGKRGNAYVLARDVYKRQDPDVSSQKQQDQNGSLDR